jgi:hypothetical protein
VFNLCCGALNSNFCNAYAHIVPVKSKWFPVDYCVLLFVHGMDECLLFVFSVNDGGPCGFIFTFQNGDLANVCSSMVQNFNAI